MARIDIEKVRVHTVNIEAVLRLTNASGTERLKIAERRCFAAS